jgi:hypothetical protein
VAVLLSVVEATEEITGAVLSTVIAILEVASGTKVLYIVVNVLLDIAIPALGFGTNIAGTSDANHCA